MTKAKVIGYAGPRKKTNEKKTLLTQQILAAIVSIIFTSVIYGLATMDQGVSTLFQLKTFFVVVIPHTIFPFSIMLLLLGFAHLKQKLYVSAPIMILCSLVLLWTAVTIN